MVSAERGIVQTRNNCCGNALLRSARVCTDGGSEGGREVVKTGFLIIGLVAQASGTYIISNVSVIFHVPIY